MTDDLYEKGLYGQYLWEMEGCRLLPLAFLPSKEGLSTFGYTMPTNCNSNVFFTGELFERYGRYTKQGHRWATLHHARAFYVGIDGRKEFIYYGHSFVCFSFFHCII